MYCLVVAFIIRVYTSLSACACVCEGDKFEFGRLLLFFFLFDARWMLYSVVIWKKLFDYNIRGWMGCLILLASLYVTSESGHIVWGCCIVSWII